MPRRSPSPPSTLAELQANGMGGWVWLHCDNPNCSHHAPVAIAPFVIRWGQETSSDVLRRSARCSKCGHKGATTIRPSWVDSNVGFQAFPVERIK